MRKVHVKVIVDLFIKAEDNVDISEMLDEMNWNFASATKGADIEDQIIDDYEVTDSR